MSINDHDDDLEERERDMDGPGQGADRLIARVEESDRHLGADVERIDRRDGIDDRLHMRRLLIVERAERGIDLDKDVKETVGWKIVPRVLLHDLTR